MTLSPPQMRTIPDPADGQETWPDLVTVEGRGNTGGVTVTVDLSAEPVRGGVAPTLTLTYSGAQNGPFGVGWRLSVPAIRRIDDHAVPRYHDADDPDPIGHDELGELVPALTPGVDGWSAVRRERDGFWVERYVPRTAQQPVRIDRWTATATGECHWIITTAENHRHVYGRDAEARIADPGHPQHVSAWLLEESSDDRGNIVTYRYVRENGDEVTAGSPEARTLQGSDAQLYLKAVQYGNRTPGVADTFAFTHVFDYGDHDDIPGPEPGRPWPLRPDPHSRRRSGFEVRTRRLCRRILLFRRPAQAAAEQPPILARADELTYDLRADGSLLTAVTRRGYDPDDVHTTAALPKVALTYTAPTGPGVISHLRIPAWNPRPRGSQRWIDLDGTGLPGLLSYDGVAARYAANLGGGRFGLERVLTTMPTSYTAGAAIGKPFGDSTTCIIDGAGALAYTRRVTGGSWASRTPFGSTPVAGGEHPNQRQIDLDGDGRDDMVLPGDGGVRWHRFEGAAGWRNSVEQSSSASAATALLDRTGRLQIADLTGDGLPDIVHVDSGTVRYWPNLGHGRFGEPIELAGATPLDDPAGFDPDRVRLFDVDGTGTADLIYLGATGVRIQRVLAGTTLAPAETLAGVPPLTTTDTVDVVDLLGTGTGCLVLSTPDPAGQNSELRYVALCDGKPAHQLQTIDNGRGLVHIIQWQPSTQFWSEDQSQTPWCTTIPAAIPLLAALTAHDQVNDVTHKTSWRYRHGVFDEERRQFRGFAMVEQRDSTTYPTDMVSDKAPQRQTLVTRRWYDTGAYDERPALEAVRAEEVWAADPDRLDPPAIVIDDSLAQATPRSLLWGLAGTLIREEVYGFNDDPRSVHPLRVTAHGVTIRVRQPATGAHPAATLLLPHEELVRHVEQDPADTRLVQNLGLAFDEEGFETVSAQVGYGRGVPAQPGQDRTCVIVTTTDVSHTHADDVFRCGTVTAERSEELLGLQGPALSRYRPQELLALVEDPTLPTIPPGTLGDRGRRLMTWQVADYWDDALTQSLPFGQVGSRALVRTVRTAVYTTAHVDQAFDGRVDDAALTAAGYESGDDAWWDPGEIVYYGSAQFYQPIRIERAGHVMCAVTYDEASLEVVTEIDSVGGGQTAGYHLVARRPVETTNADNVVRTAKYDPLGRVTALAEAAPGRPSDSLDSPTHGWIFNDGAWLAAAIPCSVAEFTRIRRGDPASPVAESVTYHDGLGNDTLRAERDSVDRWAVVVHRVADADGQSYAEANPYFAADAGFRALSAAGGDGSLTIALTDALSRPVWIENADGTQRQWTYSAWTRQEWDENDCAPQSRWLEERTGPGASARDTESAEESIRHAGTPSLIHLDALERTVAAVEDDGTPNKPTTTFDRDGSGNALEIHDARSQRAQQTIYDLRGEVALVVSADAGTTRNLVAANGELAHQWTARGHQRRFVTDSAGRLVQRWTLEPGQAWRLVERIVYGDAAPEATRTAGLLHAQPWLILDAGGLLAVRDRDINGHESTTERRIYADHQTAPNWSVYAASPADQLEAAVDHLLEAPLRTETVLDGLDLASETTHPDGTTQRFSRNPRGLLTALQVQLDGEPAVGVLVAATYDAARRPLDARYGNGVTESRTYNPRGRLKTVQTRRPNGQTIRSQEISYDAAGNPLRVTDAASPTLFYGNAAIPSSLVYRYDALNRLIRAEGREANLPLVASRPTDAGLRQFPNPADTTAVRRYSDIYTLDKCGNVTRLVHQAIGGSYTVDYVIAAQSNRIVATPGVAGAAYVYDSAGNPTTLGTQTGMAWDSDEQLVEVNLGGGGTATFRTAADGTRVSRFVQRAGAITEARQHCGSWDRFARTTAGVLQGTTDSLLVGDAQNPIALLEKRTGGPAPSVTWRYRHTDNSDNIRLETNADGQTITVEEYFPYGCTAYRAAADVNQPNKRHRFGGHERDSDISWDHHGARYYIPWIGRWANPDPAGMMDGTNRYWYARANPTRYHDPTGLFTVPKDAINSSVQSFQIGPDSKTGITHTGVRAMWTDKQGNTKWISAEQWTDAKGRLLKSVAWEGSRAPLTLPQEGGNGPPQVTMNETAIARVHPNPTGGIGSSGSTGRAVRQAGGTAPSPNEGHPASETRLPRESDAPDHAMSPAERRQATNRWDEIPETPPVDKPSETSEEKPAGFREGAAAFSLGIAKGIGAAITADLAISGLAGAASILLPVAAPFVAPVLTAVLVGFAVGTVIANFDNIVGGASRLATGEGTTSDWQGLGEILGGFAGAKYAGPSARSAGYSAGRSIGRGALNTGRRALSTFESATELFQPRLATVGGTPAEPPPGYASTGSGGGNRTPPHGSGGASNDYTGPERQLPAGGKTTRKLEQVQKAPRRFRGPWSEQHIAELHRGTTAKQAAYTSKGVRYHDVSVPGSNIHKFRIEVKNYLKWRGSPNLKFVELTDFLQQQIDKDAAWMAQGRAQGRHYLVQWEFVWAAPSQSLMDALIANGIPFIWR